MSKHNKIKVKPPINQGKRVTIESKETIEISNHDYPIFCFKHLHKDHNLDECINSEKKSLIEKIVKLSQMTWEEIRNAPKHGLGSEKISMDSIKPKCPPFIREDVSFLLALRFDGKKAMLGHKNNFIFHVIFIDRDFSVYNH